MSTTQDFKGRVALITGAGAGLGAAYARWLAARGAKVIVNNRTHPDRPSSAQIVVDEIKSAGGQAVANHESVDAPDSGQRMVEQALDCFGQLDIIIANAAAPSTAELHELTLDRYRAAFETNFIGSIDPILAGLPHMRARDYGRIVVTTSAAALFGARMHTAYAASKMAVVGFARAMSVELKRSNIKINTISPYARTKMSGDLLGEDMAEVMASERVAPVVGWLVSEQCDRSGLILSAGGGRVRRTAFIETAPVPVTDAMNLNWDVLDDLTQITETRDSRWSSTALIPELIKPRS